MTGRSRQDELSGAARTVESRLDGVQYGRGVLVLVNQHRTGSVDHHGRVACHGRADSKVVEVENLPAEALGHGPQKGGLPDGSGAFEEHNGALLAALDGDWEDSALDKAFHVVNPSRVPELPGRELRFCQAPSSVSART